MFVQGERFAEGHSHNRGVISMYGQEANPDTWKMAKMNMAIRGIDADLGQYNADTFMNYLHPTLKADYILANPPFHYHPWGQKELKEDKRWKYGLPSAGNANYAWIQQALDETQAKRTAAEKRLDGECRLLEELDCIPELLKGVSEVYILPDKNPRKRSVWLPT